MAISIGERQAEQERERAATRRPGWIDALVAFALVVAGGEGFTYLVVSFARDHNITWLPAYAGHAWILLVPLFWLLVLRRRFPLGRLNATTLRVWFWPCLIFGALALIAGLLLAAAGQLVAVGDEVQPSSLTLLMLLLFQGLFAPLSEELAYRGLIQTGLNRSIKSRIALGPLQLGYGTVLAAALFGVAHSPLLLRESLVVTEAEVLISFVAGLIAGYYYERTHSIWGAIIFHGLYSLLFVIPLLSTIL